jgi:hypothetical protein
MSFANVFVDASKLKWMSGLVSAALYGGWVFVSNYDSGPTQLFLSVFVQATVSFIATFTFSSAIYWMILGADRLVLQWYAAALVAVVIYFMILSIVHYSIGTPNLAESVLPIGTLAAAYAFYYSYRASKKIEES